MAEFQVRRRRLPPELETQQAPHTPHFRFVHADRFTQGRTVGQVVFLSFLSGPQQAVTQSASLAEGWKEQSRVTSGTLGTSIDPGFRVWLEGPSRLA